MNPALVFLTNPRYFKNHVCQQFQLEPVTSMHDESHTIVSSDYSHLLNKRNIRAVSSIPISGCDFDGCLQVGMLYSVLT